jgi:hypothetical protein
MSTTKCKTLPTRIMQTEACHKIFSFFGQDNWHMKIKFLSVQTSMKHSQSFLSKQEMFLQLSAVQFMPFLLQENAESFLTLKPVYHMIKYFVGFTVISLQES